MNEEAIKFIEWIGKNNYFISGKTGYWTVYFIYGNANNPKIIAKTTKELYEIYKNKLNN